MGKTDDYRSKLHAIASWDAFLLQESGLPGPRGNLELAQVVADEGDLLLFRRYLTYTAELAPTNSPYEFLAFCGVVGLGRLVAEGEYEHLETLRQCATDPRWRLREAVAMALQRLGDADMDRLLAEMEAWAQGSPLEQRAAAAAICEPRLLTDPRHASAALKLLDAITDSLAAGNRSSRDDLLTLRKGLGYCWSVAVVALPAEGKPLMEKWLAHPNRDVQWVMRENLKKARLQRIDLQHAPEAKMAELKTKLNDASVEAFLNGVADERKRGDAFALLAMMQEITQAEPKMWGDSIVGFGSYHYKYSSGREGDWFITGFSPRKQNLTLYFMPGFEQQGDLLAKLGKYTTGVGCLYIKRLDDVDLLTLRQMIERAINR